MQDYLDEYGEPIAIMVFSQGMLAVFQPSRDSDRVACFGGILDHTIHGASEIAKLNLVANFGSTITQLEGIPLLYAYQHEGCVMKYRVDGERVIVEHMDEIEPSNDWPYENFPRFFPEVSLAIVHQHAMSFDDFCELAVQGYFEEGDETWAHVIVPPSEAYGVSLWGEDGDAEGVQTLFSVDPEHKRVVTSNQCG